MKPRQRRLLLVLLVLALAGTAVYLTTRALRSNLVFFLTPGQVLDGEAQGKTHVRVGGLVQAGSVQRQADEVRFVLADARHAVPVVYRGILPDLFAEGKGAIAQGHLSPRGELQAAEVLAKHDENYMPPEVQKALEPSGHPEPANRVPEGGKP
jgi:cytochrome c-type biogenesis protein CcmE